VPDEADPARAAREALARAKADALAKGNRPARPPVRGPERDAAPDSATARAPGRPGRRPRRDDPEPLNAAIGGLLDTRGWHEAAAVGSVFGRWAQIVGPELAEHTRPESLTDGELTVTADSTAWATQVRLLAAHLVRRLNDELEHGSVQRVRVRGPAGAAGPARRPGEWRVRGGRGPRDTYG
jgi:predicted nucleic acid-binding Zn ribbon protein